MLALVSADALLLTDVIGPDALYWALTGVAGFFSFGFGAALAACGTGQGDEPAGRLL